MTSDRTTRLAAFLAKARADAGVPSTAVPPGPRRSLSNAEEPRVPERVDDNTAPSADRPATILSARVSPGAETADLGGAVPDTRQPDAAVASYGEIPHETISGGAVPDTRQPDATLVSYNEITHETISGGAVPDTTQPDATLVSHSETRHETISGRAVPSHATRRHLGEQQRGRTRFDRNGHRAHDVIRGNDHSAPDATCRGGQPRASASGLGLRLGHWSGQRPERHHLRSNQAEGDTRSPHSEATDPRRASSGAAPGRDACRTEADHSRPAETGHGASETDAAAAGTRAGGAGLHDPGSGARGAQRAARGPVHPRQLLHGERRRRALPGRKSCAEVQRLPAPQGRLDARRRLSPAPKIYMPSTTFGLPPGAPSR